MRIKKFMAAVMVLTLLATCIIYDGSPVKADQSVTIIINEDNVDLVVKPGETRHIRLPIKAVGSIINNPEVTFKEKGEGSLFTFSKPALKTTDPNVVATSIAMYTSTYVEFDVTVKETAQIGNYPVTLNMTGLAALNGELEAGSFSLDFELKILEEKAPIQLTVGQTSNASFSSGSNADLAIEVKNEGEVTARNVYISVDYKDTGIEANYTTKKIKVGDIAPGKGQNVALPIKILPTTTSGRKTLTFNFEYKNIDGSEVLKDTYTINVNVKKNEKAPDLYIDEVEYKGDLTPGGEFTVVATLANLGGTTAKEVSVTVDDASIQTEGFIKRFYSELEAKDMKYGGKQKIEIPMQVSNGATAGVKNLKIIISYTDEAGVSYSKTESVYPDIIGPGTSGNSNLVISGVNQSPAQPVAGDNMTVSFDLENKGTVDITELKISLANMTGEDFIPMESEPYQYIEKLAAGQTKSISIPLALADTIPEGLNNLTLNISYAGAGSVDPVIIPIRDIQNDLGSSSMPKLIVSSYTADVDKLLAGSTFNFTFDIYNTHSSVAAKNITVTVTQADNIFSVSKGSNSFFISKIAAGETATNTLELKVKSDASTKAYPLKITIEYEYDGIKPNPTTGVIGETKVEELSLQAVENSRPFIDYVNVYSWDGTVIVNTPATCTFDFYNMGKSPLNNVTATLEGDFTKTDGSMTILGNVESGASAFAEFEVIPLVEGISKGVLRITFEDSNGEQVEFTKEFETPVMGAQMMDPGMGEGGAVDVFNPEVPAAKKAILPIWLFVIIQIVIFILFIPVTRKVIIGVYKSKLRKKEEEKY